MSAIRQSNMKSAAVDGRSDSFFLLMQNLHAIMAEELFLKFQWHFNIFSSELFKGTETPEKLLPKTKVRELLDCQRHSTNTCLRCGGWHLVLLSILNLYQVKTEAAERHAGF